MGFVVVVIVVYLTSHRCSTLLPFSIHDYIYICRGGHRIWELRLFYLPDTNRLVSEWPFHPNESHPLGFGYLFLKALSFSRIAVRMTKA